MSKYLVRAVGGIRVTKLMKGGSDNLALAKCTVDILSDSLWRLSVLNKAKKFT